LLRRVIGEDVELVTAFSPDAGPVKADPGQLTQVLLNLAVNSRDAMPRGGRLTVEVRHAELDESHARAHPGARPGPHVLLAVRDTGGGIPPDVLPHIWEPFFTTKGPGVGTGLGLAVVRGVVEQAGGHVEVASAAGEGTTFRIYFPCLGGERLPAVVPPPSRVGAMPRGAETVLLVEDEDGVRALARFVLEACGYAVLEARDGAEALRLSGQHEGRLDLVVTDVVMPRMGGPEVAESVAASHPGVKVLFLSGYPDDAVVRRGLLQAEVHFLHKPYSPAALAQKVREVLDKPPHPDPAPVRYACLPSLQTQPSGKGPS
jgi:CheY-like chemotaxis protein